MTVEVTLGPGRGGGGREGREGEWEEGGEKLKQKRKKGLRIIGMLEKTIKLHPNTGRGGRTYIQNFISKGSAFPFQRKTGK